jgi:GNAT superfamily N-acetyltransferase
MLESILDGDSYVAEIGGILVGSITIDRFADPEFWSRNDAPEDALYLHRMIVDRQASGKNIGGTLIDWANGIAAREGKRWLRLDAWRTNARLHDYYRSQGFDLVRVVELSHRGSGALFQRGTGVK